MPDMTFTVRWPDGSRQRCYSPSLVVHDHLSPGTSYAVAEFVDRSRTALHAASERVRAAYGFPCSRAASSLAEIEAAGARFSDGEVVVEEMAP